MSRIKWRIASGDFHLAFTVAWQGQLQDDLFLAPSFFYLDVTPGVDLLYVLTVETVRERILS